MRLRYVIAAATRRAAFSLAGAILLVGSPANAAPYCNRPDPPSCVSMMSINLDEFSFNSCRRDVQSYRDEIEDYKRCLQNDLADAIDEYSSTVRKFNCYAKGETYCY